MMTWVQSHRVAFDGAILLVTIANAILQLSLHAAIGYVFFAGFAFGLSFALFVATILDEWPFA